MITFLFSAQENPKTIMFDYESVFFEYKKVKALSLIGRLKLRQTYAMKTDSEFVDVWSYHLQRMIEFGIVKKLEKKWFPEDGDGGRVNFEAVVLGFENLLFPFLILAMGGLAAMAISVFEALLRNVVLTDKKMANGHI